MKTSLFFLFLFLSCNVFLLSESKKIEEEYNTTVDEIFTSVFQIREKYIYHFYNSYNDNSWEIMFSGIEEDMDKIIFIFHTLSYIDFEDDKTSFLFNTVLDMAISELIYIRQINSDIERSEYGISQVIHSLDKVTQLCIVILLIIDDNYDLEGNRNT